MPIKTISGYKYLELDFRFSEKHWTILSEFVKKNIGEKEITSPIKVQEILIECFDLLCKEFIRLLNEEKKASFFIFVQDLHEDSIEIWFAQLNGPKFPLNQEDIAISRRVMKYILEQGCNLDLKGHASFYKEIGEQIKSYTDLLEELIYVGKWAFAISEYIARSKICNHSISLKIENNQFTITVNAPFSSIFNFIFKDYERHTKSVTLSNSVIEFKKVLNEELKINYDFLSFDVLKQLFDKRCRFEIFNLNQIISELVNIHGLPKNVLEVFYSGLIVSRSNLLSMEDCILKSQDSNRHMYRPILQYNIDGEICYLLGAHKWSESLTQLMTNCIPFTQFPDEWKKIPQLFEFYKRINNTHDKILEVPAIELIEKGNLKYDRNIKSLKKANNRGLSLIVKNIGEIDIVFINEQERLIYLAECKHNRSRYEYHNWQKEMKNFKDIYEIKLENKYRWISDNIGLLFEHFEILYGSKILDKEQYKVIPLFIINAPTLYMYDSKFLVVTLHDLELLLNGKYFTMEFKGEVGGKRVNIDKPYFQNAELYF